MYAKLIFQNAKRSAKDYLIYIVTLTICVTLFYAFLSISSSYYQPDIGTAYEITAFSDGIQLAVCVITLLLLFLIRYVNNYIRKLYMCFLTTFAKIFFLSIGIAISRPQENFLIQMQQP